MASSWRTVRTLQRWTLRCTVSTACTEMVVISEPRTDVRQDARCEVASDWLDQGQRDLSVPEVPAGFMREVVLKYNSQSTAPSRTVYYHYFEQDGETVRRTALLRAKGGDGDDTVEGFLRSHPRKERLRHSNFNFEDAVAKGRAGAKFSAASAQQTAVRPRAGSRPASTSATSGEAKARIRVGCHSLSGFARGGSRSASTSSRGRAAVVSESSEDEAEATADDCVGHSSFPALKCSEHACRRWHHVPADVQKMVRFAAPEHTYARTHTVVAFVPNMC